MAELNPHQFGKRYVWDVDYAHNKDTLKQGNVTAGTHRVSVLAHNDDDARLAAEQMVAARGYEPTGARLHDFPAE